MSIKLMVGLQNPGKAYDFTRHNAGGWFIEELAKTYQLTFKLETALKAKLAAGYFESYDCRIALPTTFMNHSGQCVGALMRYFRLDPEELLIIHDELDLPCGSIRLKTGGGHGGHNGVRDVMSQLGQTHFHRLRIGIGHPGNKNDVLDYVLGKPSLVDKEKISKAIEKGIDHLSLLFSEGISSAMTQLNQI